MLAHPRVYERKTSDTPSFFFSDPGRGGGEAYQKTSDKQKKLEKTHDLFICVNSYINDPIPLVCFLFLPFFIKVWCRFVVCPWCTPVDACATRILGSGVVVVPSRAALEARSYTIPIYAPAGHQFSRCVVPVPRYIIYFFLGRGSTYQSAPKYEEHLD